MKSLPNLHSRPQAQDGAPGRDWFFPLNGWLLTALVRLEEDAPHTLLFAYKACALWRNAVAVAFATGALERPESFLLRAHGDLDESKAATSLRAQFASAICQMRPQRIVEAALDKVPPSLCGALQKIGFSPLSTAEAYRRLIALLGSTSAVGRARRRVLEQISGCRLTDDILQVVECLDLALLTPTTATQVRNAEEAHRLNASLGAIRRLCSTATDAALRESADAMGIAFDARRFARSWLAKADRLEPLGIPLDRDPDIVRINPATAEAAGRRWRNCLAGYAHEMAAGASAFFAIEKLSVIAVLRLTDAGWLLVGVHTHDNGPISREIVAAVTSRLSGLGVLCIRPISGDAVVASAVGGFRRDIDWDFDFAGLDV